MSTVRSAPASYAHEWLPCANQQGEKPSAFIGRALVTAPPPEQVDIAELQRFFKKTCGYFCNHRLRVYFDEANLPLAETEPFTLEHLDLYQLTQTILDCLIAGDKPDAIYALQQAKGTLPFGTFGHQLFNEKLTLLKPMANYIQAHLDHSSPERDAEINLTLNSIRITGWLKQNRSNGLIRYRTSTIKGKDILAGWLEHLCYCAMGHHNSTTLIGIDKKKQKTARTGFSAFS